MGNDCCRRQFRAGRKKKLADICSADSRVKLYYLEKNYGPAYARNIAIEKANGRWIAFLDADDLWVPTKINDSINYLMISNAGLVYTGLRRISSCGQYYGRYLNVPSSITYRKLLGNTVIATSSVVIDRYRVGKMIMRRVYYDDYDAWLSLLKRGHKAVGLQKDLLRYRCSVDSYSSKKLKSSWEVWKMYRYLYGFNVVLALFFFLNYSLRAFIKHYYFRPKYRL